MDFQALVDGAAPGSTVTLPPGTWRGTLVVTKALALAGAGAGKTLIDAEGHGPCIVVDAPEAEVRISGLSLLHGSSPRGGGLCLQNGALHFEDASVEGCACRQFGGGGLLLSGQRARLVRVVVSGGTAAQGGGLLVDDACEVEAVGCVFTRNAAEVGGGIRLVEGARLRLVHCTVAGNQGRGRTPLGREVALSGTTSRVPELHAVNSVFAPSVAGTPAVVQVGAIEGRVELSHCLLPQAMNGTPGPGNRFGDPEFMPSGGHRCALGPSSPAAAGAEPGQLPDNFRDLRGRPLQRAGEADMGAYSVA